MAQIAVIGAGLTGLSTAYALEQRGMYDYALFESESTCGGLCRTVRNEGFTFDYTGHFLHCTHPDALKFLEQTLSIDKLNRITRNSSIYSQGAYTHFPYQSNLHGLPISTIAECIEGFVQKKIPSNVPRESFACWVMENFGAGFAKHFFYPYQEKLLCHSVQTITDSWVGRFVPDTTLEKIIEGIINPSPTNVGYNAHFYYPQAGGIDNLIASILRKLVNRPHMNHKATSIDVDKRIIYFNNGHHESFEFLVSTVPLKTILHSLNKREYEDAASHLKCNFLLNINFGFEQPEIVPYHWIYYPEKIYPFFRIGVPHLLTQTMAPAHHSSLAIEIASTSEPPSLKKAVSKARSVIKTLFKIKPQKIVHECILKLPHAYVLYDRWRDQHLVGLLNDLEKQKIYSIGRYGAWKYSSMQEAILDGMQAADRIVTHVGCQLPTHTAITAINAKQKMTSKEM